MGAVHRSPALHRIAEAVAIRARKQPPRSVELGNLPAAIHAVATDIAWDACIAS